MIYVKCEKQSQSTQSEYFTVNIILYDLDCLHINAEVNVTSLTNLNFIKQDKTINMSESSTIFVLTIVLTENLTFIIYATFGKL